jgi:translocation and assembly module TamB
MARRLRTALIIAAIVLVALPLLIVGAVLLIGNLDSGRHFIERTTERVTAGGVRLSGLGGRFPSRLHLAQLQLQDRQGVWLTAQDIQLNTSPLELLSKEGRVNLLHAGLLAIDRAPDYGPAKSSSSSSSGMWFRELRLDRLDLQRLELGPALTGDPVAVRIQASARIYSLQLLWAQVSAQRLDSVPSVYQLAAQIDPKQLNVRVDVQEDTSGPLTHLAHVPQLGALDLHLHLNGPREAVQTDLELHAGELVAVVKGSMNLKASAADLAVDLDSPAITPIFGVSWQRLSLHGAWHGTLSAPTTTGKLEARELQAPDVHARTLVADLRGEADKLLLDASVGGFGVETPALQMPASNPLVLHAEAKLGARARPIDFTLSNPLINLRGHWNLSSIDGSAVAEMSEIRPFVAMGGLNLGGRGTLNVRFSATRKIGRLESSAELDVRDGAAPLAQLLRGRTHLQSTLLFRSGALEFDNTRVDAANTHASMGGTIPYGGPLALSWKATLTSLAVLSPQLTGNLVGSGQVRGASPNVALDADVSGQLSAHGSPSGPLHLVVHTRDVPQHANGTLELSGTLDGAALELLAQAEAAKDGGVAARIERGDWKSLHIQGAMHVDAKGERPEGRFELRAPQLTDLDRLLGAPLQGALDASVLFDTRGPGRSRAHVTVDAKDVGVPAQQIEELQVRGHIDNPTTEPVLALRIAAKTSWSERQTQLTVNASGPLARAELRATASLEAAGDGEGIVDAPAQLEMAATLDTNASILHLSAFKVDYRKQNLQLLAPADIHFGDAVSFDELSLGSADAQLRAQGRLTPTLELHAAISNVTAAQLHALWPTLEMDGRVDAHADLHGSLAMPTGVVEMHAAGLRAGSGAARGLPATNIDLNAQLGEQTAQVDLRMHAGEGLDLTVNGQAPMSSSATMALKANGAFDLNVLNPILEAGGQRAQGKAKIDAQLDGTPQAPQARGELVLAGVNVQDYSRGFRLTDVNATLSGTGDTLQLRGFTAKAGSGTITADGSIKFGDQAWPVDVKVSAHDAQPLASDLLTANVTADLTLTGDLLSKLTGAGTVHVNRAVINIPNAFPPDVPTLNVVRAGQKPPPPPKPSRLVVALDYKVTAPRAVFVRGRGIDAELGGELRVTGTSTDVSVSGRFDMQQGTINLGGTTLTFDRDSNVSFDGSGVHKRIDPSLYFKATQDTGQLATAELDVTGYADAPVITLKSNPEGEPQDQILSQLLFGTANVSQLSPLQLAQIGAALVTLGGIGGSGRGFNPINTIQKKLGLDRLSIGGGGGTGSTGGPGSPNALGAAPGQADTNAATIEAGRYISSRVYVGAKQSTLGPTQAQVQIDLTKKLKLQATLGNGGGTVQGATPQNDPGSNAGIAYQFEY